MDAARLWTELRTALGAYWTELRIRWALAMMPGGDPFEDRLALRFGDRSYIDVEVGTLHTRALLGGGEAHLGAFTEPGGNGDRRGLRLEVNGKPATLAYTVEPRDDDEGGG